MKTRGFHQSIVLMAAALATVACQNELKEEYNEPKPGEKITMTIRATQGAASQTRTDYEDKLGIAGIAVKWEGGSTDGAPVERIKVFGVNANELGYSVDFNSLPSSLSQDGTSISFEGTIDARSLYFAMYPADNCIYNTEGQAIYTSFSGQTQDCAKPMAHLKGFDLMVGRAATPGSYDKLTFSHEAAMIRFSLKNVPSTEKITRVSLAAANNKLSSRMYALLAGSSIDGLTVEADTDYAPVSSLSLDITNHTPSTEPLKAYMMIPPCDLSNDLLTVTVNTESGNTYTGDLTTAAGTLLEAGLCYTLEPTLALGKTISLPPATEGSLESTLNNITPTPEQTELAVTGAVNTDDITALATFLKENKAEKITAIDLSGISGIAEVTGFADCAKLEKVILPDPADAIGDNAFEGCTALTTVIQNEPMPADAAPATRASISKRIKKIGNSAFKNCTSMTEMFLHADIQSVGNNAFEGCTTMTALIFEGTKAANGNGGISLGTGIITGTHPDIKIFLPAITELAMATAYKTILGENPTYYNFAGYGSATTTEEKTNPASYTLIPTVPVDTMQFTVEVESGDLGFSIPFPESGNTPANITVDWGDGTAAVAVPKGTTLAAGDAFQHTYAAAGTYTITITSDATADKQQIPVLNFYQRAGSYNQNKLVSLKTPLLNMNCSSLSKAFYSCEKLTTIPENLFEKNKAATDFSGCFYYCSALQTIPGGLFANNTAATDFNSCFFNCNLLKEIPSELFAKNTEARGFNYCFANCKGLNAIPENLFEKNTAATNFSYCFYNCILLGSIPKELFASNTAATNFSYCFSSCKALTTIPESLFANNTEATNFDQCFADCIALTTIEARLFANNANINIIRCFYGCIALTTISTDLFANNTAIKSFNYCFYDCTALQTIPEGLFANNAEATSFNYCFANCNGLTAIPGNLFEKNKAATDFRNCFQSCRALKEIPGGLFTNNTAATNFSYCFYGCTGLQTIPEGLFAKNAEAINFNSCFYGCTYMMFNPNIFVNPAAAEQDKLNRFIDKDMDFRNCFYQVNLHNNSGTAPALWSYAKGSGNWTTANCFKGCIMSNSEDIKDYSTWGTPKF